MDRTNKNKSCFDELMKNKTFINKRLLGNLCEGESKMKNEPLPESNVLDIYGVCPTCSLQLRDKVQGKYYSKLIGIYDQQKDETVAYLCPQCRTEYDRFTGSIILKKVMKGGRN